MKNRILIFLIIMCGSSSIACDFCNCYLGLNPHYKKNSVGLRYHYMPYVGTQTSPLVLESMGLSKKDFWEMRKEVELHAQWYPVQRLQVIVSVPYQINTEGTSSNVQAVDGGIHTHADGTIHMHSSGKETNEGMGDPIALAHYQLFNQVNDSGKYSQRLLTGAGIKMPFGKYKIDEDDEAHERNHKPGTGSWDILLSAVYLGKINKTGLNINATYLIANTNNQHFQFGNKLNVNLTVYREQKIKQVGLFPNLGLYYEQSAKEWDKSYYIQNSGGSIIYTHAGLDVYYKKLSLNTALQLPVSKNLNGNQAEIKYRIITGISYAIN